MSSNNGNAEKIVQAIEELGPMTLKQLVEETGLQPKQIYNVVYQSPRIHVVKWAFGLNPRKIGYEAMYGMSPGPDVKKPAKQGQKVWDKRSRAKKQAKKQAIKMNSVFNLGAMV
jgi:hypothetical protein